MQMGNTYEFGPVDAPRHGLLPKGHEQANRHSIDCSFRDLAAALVALELRLGGCSRVAMA
jgi:hypothetical protein